MKRKNIILLLIVGIVGSGLIFYFKPSKPIENSASIDMNTVTKHKRRLDLISNNKSLKSYPLYGLNYKALIMNYL